MKSIVSIHSFRGGTGKSNITSNLAVECALAGHRVGVIDTDIQSPGIHVLFQLDEARVTYALNDYLWGRCAIEEAAYEVTDALQGRDRLGHAGRGSVFLIPSSLRVGEIAKVLREGYDVSLLNDGFRELGDRLELDFLFIDTHPGLNEETLVSIAVSDYLLVVLRPDQQDYQGTGVTVEVARKLQVPRMSLVVNKVPRSLTAAAVRQKVTAAYGCQHADVLPLSEDIIELGSKEIFCLRAPEHPFSQGIRAINARICEV